MQQFDPLTNGFTNYIALINSIDHWVFLKNMPKNRDCVLDIGCGSGLLTNVLRKHFKKAIGIDVSSEMIQVAKNTCKNCEFICSDANKLNFPDAYFDMVVSQHTFHHLDREKASNEVKRVLKKGGVCVIVDPSRENRKFIKKIKRLIYRILYAKTKLRIMYGSKIAKACWEYSDGPEWRKHREEDKKTEFSKQDTRDFYTRMFSGCKIKTINYHVDAVIWKKESRDLAVV